MLPNFAIIGAQKSGTTFLGRALGRHPHVFLAEGEVRYFEDPEFQRWSRSRFESLFDGGYSAKAVGMARPDCLARPECAPRMREMLPGARLVAVLRSPVERAISAYFHQMRYGFIPVAEVGAGMLRVLRGEYAWSHPKSAEILEYGFYHRHLARFVELFGREKLLVLRFEDLKRRPLESVRRVVRFLDLDDSLLHSLPRSNEDQNLGTYSLSRLRFVQLRNRIAYRYDDEKTKIDFDTSPGGWRWLHGKAVTATDRYLLARLLSAPEPSLPADLSRLLYGLYDDDVQQLADFLGEDLTAWRQPPAPPVVEGVLLGAQEAPPLRLLPRVA